MCRNTWKLNFINLSPDWGKYEGKQPTEVQTVVADKDSLPCCTLSDQRKMHALLGKAIRDVELSWKEGGLAVWTCFHCRENKWSHLYTAKQISWGGFSRKIKEGLACSGGKINVYVLLFGLKKIRPLAKLGVSLTLICNKICFFF